MKTFLKIILGIIVLGVIVYAAIMFFTAGARDVAKQFVILNSTGSYSEAHVLLHPSLQEQFTIDQLAEGFAGVKPYEDVSFSSVEASGGTTKLNGTATTADGCSTKVEFEVLDSQIIQFNITPLCR